MFTASTIQGYENHKTSHGSRNSHQQSYKNTPSSGRSNAHRIRRRSSTLFGAYLEDHFLDTETIPPIATARCKISSTILNTAPIAVQMEDPE